METESSKKAIAHSLLCESCSLCRLRGAMAPVVGRKQAKRDGID